MTTTSDGNRRRLALYITEHITDHTLTPKKIKL